MKKIWVQVDNSLVPCLRLTLMRRTFTAVLFFMVFTLIVTYALYGRWSNRNSLALNEKVLTSQARKKFLTIHRSDDTQSDEEEDWQIRLAEERFIEDHGKEKGAMNGEERKKAIQVVSLLNEKPTNHSMLSETIDRTLLMSYVDLLRDAMVRHSNMVTQPSVPRPSCVGDVQAGEVEDILCIPKPNYLKQVKNPCWYEASVNSSTQRERVLHCLPYFHVLGFAKSATTDLWQRLRSHRHIVGNLGIVNKSCLWWSWRRYGVTGYKYVRPVKFKRYVTCFNNFAQKIALSLDQGLDDHKTLVTGDGTPLDFMDFRGWPNITQNRGLEWPTVLTPHLMQHFYDNPKFIIIFREPIERLYSDYFFLGNGLTSQDFHNDIIRSIVILTECVKQYNFKACLYSHELYHKMPLRFSFACYSVFMREWLQVFPLKHFYFIKTEEYEANTVKTLNAAFKFLDLDLLLEPQMQNILKTKRARVTEQKKIAGPMKASTREILTKLLQPCSHLLARMIQQPDFVWNS